MRKESAQTTYLLYLFRALTTVGATFFVLYSLRGIPTMPYIALGVFFYFLAGTKRGHLTRFPRFFRVYAITGYAVTLFVVGLLTGGLSAPALTWAIIAVASAAFMLDRPYFIASVIANFSLIAGIFIIQKQGLLPESRLTPDMLETVRVVSLFGGILFSAILFTKINSHMRSMSDENDELSKLHRMLKTIFDEAEDYIGIADAEGNIIYHNRSFNNITGKNPEDFDDLRISDFHPDWALEKLKREGLPRASREGSWIGETAIIDADGNEVPVLQTIIFHSESNINSTIMKNISNLKQRERTLQEARDAAEDATKAKALFLANMSHEIRTPLNGVLGMTAILRDEIRDPSSSNKLQIIERSGKALLSIINDILDYSKIDANKVELESISFDLSRLVEDVGTLAKAGATSKGLEIEILSNIGSRAHVNGDPTKLRQVLTNLLDNAIKFTKSGSVRFSVKARSEGIDFMIEDSGIGIPSDKLDELFQPFSQVDASTTRVFGGTGLGLAISRRLVDLMGGQLYAASSVDQGTTFKFSLPMKVIVPVEIDQDPGKQSIDLPKDLRILVAEDNGVNAIVIRGLLKKLGLKADFAKNGEEATAMAIEKIYDVILMDCQMPVKDGFSATRDILADPRSGSPFVIAVTASALNKDRDRCIAAGMRAFVSKPIEIGNLQSAIAESLINTSRKAI